MLDLAVWEVSLLDSDMIFPVTQTYWVYPEKKKNTVKLHWTYLLSRGSF